MSCASVDVLLGALLLLLLVPETGVDDTWCKLLSRCDIECRSLQYGTNYKVVEYLNLLFYLIFSLLFSLLL